MCYYLSDDTFIKQEKPFKTKELSGQIGSARLSFATSQQMLEYLDTLPGAAGLMSLVNDKKGVVYLLVDEDILKEPMFGCHPCVNTSCIRMKTGDAFGPVLKAMGHVAKTVTLAGQ